MYMYGWSVLFFDSGGGGTYIGQHLLVALCHRTQRLDVKFGIPQWGIHSTTVLASGLGTKSCQKHKKMFNTKHIIDCFWELFGLFGLFWGMYPILHSSTNPVQCPPAPPLLALPVYGNHYQKCMRPMLRYFSLSHIQPSKICFRVKKFPLDIFIFVEFRFRICNQNFLTLPQFGDVVR